MYLTKKMLASDFSGSSLAAVDCRVPFPDAAWISEGFEESQDRRYCLPTLAAAYASRIGLWCLMAA